MTQKESAVMCIIAIVVAVAIISVTLVSMPHNYYAWRYLLKGMSIGTALVAIVGGGFTLHNYFSKKDDNE